MLLFVPPVKPDCVTCRYCRLLTSAEFEELSYRSTCRAIRVAGKITVLCCVVATGVSLACAGLTVEKVETGACMLYYRRLCPSSECNNTDTCYPSDLLGHANCTAFAARSCTIVVIASDCSHVGLVIACSWVPRSWDYQFRIVFAHRHCKRTQRDSNIYGAPRARAPLLPVREGPCSGLGREPPRSPDSRTCITCPPSKCGIFPLIERGEASQ